jgi:N-acylneuraminate cytidylyltransferase
MSNICIIPARGGSKRIPRKNIKDFLGKPIIAYSIEAALKSGLFDAVMVSTDDKEIANIAKEYGADVPFLRSEKNSNDFATTIDVLNEVLVKFLEKDKSFENVCCLYSCAPFVTKQKLINSYKMFIEKGFDSVFPILEYSFPIQRAMTLSEGKVDMIHKEFITTRSQDLNKSYHDAGQFYWLKPHSILVAKKIFTENTGGIIISEIEGQDIDNEVDWILAEMKYKVIFNEA